MSPPFPRDLPPSAARRDAVVLLVLFYAVIYGLPFLVGGMRARTGAPVLSSLLIGTLMLLAVVLFARGDRSWRESLGLGPYPVKAALGWGLLGFVGTYAGNIVLTTAYVSMTGGLEAVAARRAGWLGMLAELPILLIVPLAAFAAIWEEALFRGFLLGRLRAAIPADTPHAHRRRDALAVALTAIAFGAGHGYQGVLGLGQTTFAGVALGTLTVWRGSIWPAIATHLIIDAFGLLLLQALKSSLPITIALGCR